MPYFWIFVVWVDGFLGILKHFLDLSRYDSLEYEVHNSGKFFCSLIPQCRLRLLDVAVLIVRFHCHEKILDGPKILIKTGGFATGGKFLASMRQKSLGFGKSS